METFGQLMRRLRGRTSLRELARRTYLDSGHLSRIENDYRRPTAAVAVTLDTALGAGGALVALAEAVRAGTRPAPRHDSTGPTGGGERLRYALEHPGRVDLEAVTWLWMRVRELDARYDRTPSTSLLADTGQCLGQVSFLRGHARADRVRRELCAVEADAATLMGQLVWDASQRRDHTTALSYFDQAIHAARQVPDPGAEGLALLRTSFVALYGQKDPQAGLVLARRTADTTRHTSRVLCGLATLHVAEAHAMLGQRRECEQALGQAESCLEQIDPADPAIELFSPTQLGRLAGSCYLFLNDAARAQPLLRRTAETLRDMSKSQAIVLGNLALACIRQANLDEAAAALHRALDVVEATWGGGGLNIVFRAGRELRPWRQVAAVQEVHDRLLALMAAA